MTSHQRGPELLTQGPIEDSPELQAFRADSEARIAAATAASEHLSALNSDDYSAAVAGMYPRSAFAASDEGLAASDSTVELSAADADNDSSEDVDYGRLTHWLSHVLDGPSHNPSDGHAEDDPIQAGQHSENSDADTVEIPAIEIDQAEDSSPLGDSSNQNFNTPGDASAEQGEDASVEPDSTNTPTNPLQAQSVGASHEAALRGDSRYRKLHKTLADATKRYAELTARANDRARLSRRQARQLGQARSRYTSALSRLTSSEAFRELHTPYEAERGVVELPEQQNIVKISSWLYLDSEVDRRTTALASSRPSRLIGSVDDLFDRFESRVGRDLRNLRRVVLGLPTAVVGAAAGFGIEVAAASLPLAAALGVTAGTLATLIAGGGALWDRTKRIVSRHRRALAEEELPGAEAERQADVDSIIADGGARGNIPHPAEETSNATQEVMADNRRRQLAARKIGAAFTASGIFFGLVAVSAASLVDHHDGRPAATAASHDPRHQAPDSASSTRIAANESDPFAPSSRAHASNQLSDPQPSRHATVSLRAHARPGEYTWTVVEQLAGSPTGVNQLLKLGLLAYDATKSHEQQLHLRNWVNPEHRTIEVLEHSDGRIVNRREMTQVNRFLIEAAQTARRVAAQHQNGGPGTRLTA